MRGPWELIPKYFQWLCVDKGHYTFFPRAQKENMKICQRKTAEGNHLHHQKGKEVIFIS